MLVIPTYNERENIASLVVRIRGAAGDLPILFVDDDSPDGTADEIRRIQQMDSHVHLYARPAKAGLGSAYREAFQKIIRERVATYVIGCDADLSHPPEALPRMLELLRSCPVVVGSRYVAGGSTENWKALRRFISRGANTYARILTGVPVNDLTAGFVGYQIEALGRIDLDKIRSDGYAFLVEMKYALHRAGARLCEFPITFTDRRVGRSKLSGRMVLEGIRFPLKVLYWRVVSQPPD